MRKKALVIDDDAYCLDIAAEYLQDMDFDVISSLSPICPMMEQNLDSCPMQIPCFGIILSDNHMPGMTGLEFFAYQAQRGCKVSLAHKAIISGDISEENRDIAESAGYKIFQKTASLDLLDDWIEEILGVNFAEDNSKKGNFARA